MDIYCYCQYFQKDQTRADLVVSRKEIGMVEEIIMVCAVISVAIEIAKLFRKG
jgi:hypothetical protein